MDNLEKNNDEILQELYFEIQLLDEKIQTGLQLDENFQETIVGKGLVKKINQKFSEIDFIENLNSD